MAKLWAFLKHLPSLMANAVLCVPLLQASTLLMQDIKSFVFMSDASPVLALRDMAGTGRLESSQTDYRQPGIDISIDKVSIWFPSTTLYVLLAFSANVRDLGESIAKRSSEEDAIKASQVPILQ